MELTRRGFPNRARLYIEPVGLGVHYRQKKDGPAAGQHVTGGNPPCLEWLEDLNSVIGDDYRPDAAIPSIDCVFTMEPDKAAFACRLIRTAVVIPQHYGTFPALMQNTDKFKDQVRQRAPAVQVAEAVTGKNVELKF